MVSSESLLVKSSLDVGQNAAQSFLFLFTALLLQFAVYRVFALIACKRKAFMPYLMFAEDAIQKAMFIAYSSVKRNGLLVLCFAACLGLAGVYDTFIGSLYAPGYVMHKSKVNA
jgi:hypothetical protein